MEEIRIFLAEGFEEIEALTVVDMLRREEMDIKMVSITGKEIVTGSHNISVKADILFEKADFTKTDMLILPGGMPGTENLRAFSPLKDLICLFQREGKKLAAICAAPTVFGDLGILEGKRACCYPGMESQLKGAKVTEEKVEIDGNVITSRGMGTAIPFGAAIIEIYKGKEAALNLKKKIVYGHVEEKA